MKKVEIFNIELIKEQLVKSCKTCNAKDFLPYLLSPLVRIDFPNKIRFYSFLKYLLETAKEKSGGALELRIEAGPWEEDEELLAYNFYDEVHKFPRINLKVKEIGDEIFINVKPF